MKFLPTKTFTSVDWRLLGVVEGQRGARSICTIGWRIEEKGSRHRSLSSLNDAVCGDFAGVFAFGFIVWGICSPIYRNIV